VEGYVESIATGLLAGVHAAALARDSEPVAPPRATEFGALVNYICHADAKNFQPANITFDLLLPVDDETCRRIRDKKQRHAIVCQRALEELEAWLATIGNAFAHGLSRATIELPHHERG